ncbi:MAG: type II CAAX endopeptidase family protein [archaeon]|nr:CPBP family intramembrane metalloprotease [archaeon]MDD2477404.1 type II CAAX endopeptidase family protein [Candidatus ainarchaeum sp.]MDD3084483.1 type II CAAX endopeptidase family protein [Candidatus ainarchaeum sp.]MDD4220764.1 type II CAAX endopeptidase family protein [Candidatus ainarchaeum sp.]MDD4662263.1 type II CAAX endopeptidase family protein [Candidatus ainarchaeum sp.]
MIKTTIILSILQVIILFILPIYLVYKKIIPFKYRLHTIFGIAILATVIVLLEGWSLADLGFILEGFGSHVIPYLAFTVLVSLAIVYLSEDVLKRNHYINYWSTRKMHILIIIPLCFVQELLFRGFLIPKLEVFISSFFFVALANAILFMLMHTIYSVKFIDLLFIFIEGFLLAMIYIFYPNLLLITLAHSVHNYIAVFYKYFVAEK